MYTEPGKLTDEEILVCLKLADPDTKRLPIAFKLFARHLEVMILNKRLKAYAIVDAQGDKEMSDFLTPRQIEVYRKLYYKIMHNRGRPYDSYLSKDQYDLAHAIYIQVEHTEEVKSPQKTVEQIVLTELKRILDHNTEFTTTTFHPLEK